MPRAGRGREGRVSPVVGGGLRSSPPRLPGGGWYPLLPCLGGGRARTPRGHTLGARTPGSGRVKDDLHPAALSPRSGVRVRARVLVLREQLGVPRGGQHPVPHRID